MIKYSVIIPAYNSENTIRRCLDSLLDQHREDIELIVINDGSEDGTAEICREYAANNPCICYLEQENGGVSSARNLGLDNATGEYILFVDSDDHVTDNSFRVLDDHMAEGLDLLMFGWTKQGGRGPVVHDLPDAAAQTPEETARLVCKAICQQRMNSVWSKAYRRDLIEKLQLRFDERLSIGEDKVFAVSYALGSRSVKTIPDAIYAVSLENSKSLSRHQREDLCDHVLLEHELLFEAVANSPYEQQYKKAVSFSFYRSAYTVIRRLLKAKSTQETHDWEIREICARYREKGVRAFGGLRHWLISLPIRWKAAWLIKCILRMQRYL